MNKRIRSYHWNENSKRLSPNKVSTVNGVSIRYEPGSCYHAIIYYLAKNKNTFCTWNDIVAKVQRYMMQFGGEKAWNQFKNKKRTKPFQQRIKDNVRILTRSGLNCFGHRLHEVGSAIYCFSDGALLKTNGKPSLANENFNIIFPDGSGFQTKYRGKSYTYNQYVQYVKNNWMNSSGTILDIQSIRKDQSMCVFNMSDSIGKTNEEWLQVLERAVSRKKAQKEKIQGNKIIYTLLSKLENLDLTRDEKKLVEKLLIQRLGNDKLLVIPSSKLARGDRKMEIALADSKAVQEQI